MEKTTIEKINAIKQFLRKANNQTGKTVEQIRLAEAGLIAAFPKIPDVSITKTMIANLSAEWVQADTVPKESVQLVLYFHGGGFITGSCDSHRDLAARISKSSGVRVLVIEYRLAPEHKYPAANEDCIAAYLWLIENGFDAANIILGGDSVGGSLALMTLLSLRDAGNQLPAAAFLLSPHTDLIHLDGESYTSRAELDPTGSLEGNRALINYYLASSAANPAILSPLKGNLTGLPDLFIQVGDHEVLLSDSIRLEEQAKEAGIQVTLQVWENMWCVFQFLAHMLPEAQQAINEIGQFVKKYVKS
ncbi:MAG: hydrolase [Bacilli bacterium]|nr:hydrolase [Bacilli bacterium]